MEGIVILHANSNIEVGTSVNSRNWQPRPDLVHEVVQGMFSRPVIGPNQVAAAVLASEAQVTLPTEA